MDKDSKGQRKGEMTLWGNRERYGQGQQRTEKERDDIVGTQGTVWTKIAKDRGMGEMTLWGNKERYGQGQQRTEKGRYDIVGQQGAVWTRTAKDRERWRTLAEGYFLQWKDTAWN